MLDRTAAPPFNKIKKIVIKQPEKIRLDNGVDLYTIQSGSQEILKLDILFDTGKYEETHNGSAYIGGKMMAEGIPGKSSTEIAAFFESFGAHLEITPGLDHLEISLYCLSKHFANIVDVFRDIITKPIFPDSELETQKNIRIQSLHVNNEKNGFVATKLFREALFGSKHPYGIILQDDDILTTTKTTVQEYADRNILNHSFTVIASGNFGPEVIDSIINTFGGIKIDKANPRKTVEIVPSNEDSYLEKEESVQSSIRMGSISLKMDHPDFLTLLVTNEILGGYFGSRLMKNIREDKGLTYGIYSGFSHLSQAGYFVISADVKKSNREEAIEEIIKEIIRMQIDLVDSNELDTIRNYMLGQLQSSVNTPFELASKFKSLLFNGLSYSYYTSLIHTINHITPEEIREITNKFLNPSAMRVITVG